ncbi:two-component system, OmpR family, response regulator [Bradyrhizobium erythrophlei]|jgi:two-component system OmpR family response regulator|nr:two-component system, OmpR family, response regulator [Bradyrhizobium erythrophlei]
MPKVLLIEDDSTIADAITEQLTDRGFLVEWSSNGVDGLDKARLHQPDVVIIDRMLPDMDGVVAIEALRKGQMRIPVLVLSALDTVEERVRALNMGSDDYLAKPFAAAELFARIEALLRRPAQANEVILRVGPLELDRIERTAKRGGRKIELQPRQFRLLEYMMRRADQLVTRGMLLQEVWGYKFVPTTSLVDVHIGQLRQKVDGSGEIPLINTVRGAGFILSSRGAQHVIERSRRFSFPTM